MLFLIIIAAITQVVRTMFMAIQWSSRSSSFIETTAFSRGIFQSVAVELQQPRAEKRVCTVSESLATEAAFAQPADLLT